MIRITSGTAKGRKLELPKNKKITAVKEVVKLAMFSILGDRVEGSKCLDLFAGSGNLGIEALSRGAAWCDFVDESKQSVESIERNLRLTNFVDSGSVIWDDVLRYLANIETKYDIIFADPYYADTNQKHLLKLTVERLNPDGTLFFLMSSKNSDMVLPKEIADTVNHETRRYGGTTLAVISKSVG